MGEPPDASRRVDEATLRYLQRVLAGRREVRGTSLFPANKQESLLVSLDTDYYPPPIEGVRLELRIYASGEFHVSYVENYLEERRRCRWDRHEQDHNARDHFHPLPTASTADARDREFPADVTGLLETVVLPWVDDRLGTLWDE